MANTGLVAFLRRQQSGHAQLLFEDVRTTQLICAKAIDELCSQLRGHAGQEFAVNDGSRKKSIVDLQRDAHRIGDELADLADAKKPISDRKAASLVAALFNHAHDIVDVTAQIKGRLSAPDLLDSARKFARDCSSIVAICDAYETGTRDAQKRTRGGRPH